MLDYSRISRHLLVTAGDDGTVHLWDVTGRSPKVCNVFIIGFGNKCIFRNLVCDNKLYVSEEFCLTDRNLGLLWSLDHKKCLGKVCSFDACAVIIIGVIGI